jgi:hypothetical protein
MAIMYFIAVRLAGWRFFNYGKEKTYKDLIMEMSRDD